jgi:uncharacterized membrane protein YhaH (DUF805 family)
MNYFIAAMRKYAVFSGRASRKEYWYFTLFATLISFGIGIVAGILEVFLHNETLSYVSIIYFLATLLPSIAVAVRRLHDTNRSGWWGFVPIYGLVLMCSKGDPNTNRFGAPPRPLS